jgi:NitT/TauT family transport system ATP-binding protein
VGPEVVLPAAPAAAHNAVGPKHLLLQRVELRYRKPSDEQEFVALQGVDLAIERGEFIAIVGPSGCGKSSLLLVIQGLLKPSAGQVCLNGKPISGPGQDRALVFQEFALLPWRSVAHNVELGLELQRLPAQKRRQIAQENIRRVGLARFADYFPHQLSGGMRQRVGIARALAVDPEVLLMDEPFGALDAQMRQLMATELLRIWEVEPRKTIVFVTHDVDEAVFLADRVLVMSAGPGRVLEVIPVELPRPREPDVRNSPTFAEYRRRIWQHLEREVRASLDVV